MKTPGQISTAVGVLMNQIVRCNDRDDTSGLSLLSSTLGGVLWSADWKRGDGLIPVHVEASFGEFMEGRRDLFAGLVVKSLAMRNELKALQEEERKELGGS